MVWSVDMCGFVPKKKKKEVYITLGRQYPALLKTYCGHRLNTPVRI